MSQVSRRGENAGVAHSGLKARPGIRGKLQLAVWLAAAFLFAGFGSAGEPALSPFSSYRDIPGVTEEETAALERLQSFRKRFTYGMAPSAECFLREDGEIGGFTALFCDWLSEVFGIPFVPSIHEWNDLLAGLESRRVDFCGDLTPTPERQGRFFMSSPISMRRIKCLRPSDGRSLADMPAPIRPRLLFLEGTITYAQIADKLPANCETSFVDGYATAFRKLKNGEADALIDDDDAHELFDADNGMVSESFTPLSFSPVSLTAANPDLQPVVSVLNKALANGALRHLANLHKQGRADYLAKKFRSWLTPGEKAYIERHTGSGRFIPIGLERDNYPNSFYNEREGKWQGMALDILSELEPMTGLSFRRGHENPEKWGTLLNMLERGEVSLVSELIRTPGREGRFLWSDAPYRTSNYILISRSDFPPIGIEDVFETKVALIRETGQALYFQSWFPGHPLTREYATMDEAVQSLESGDTDLLMASEDALLAIINYREKPGFYANLLFDQSIGSAFGFPAGETELRSIVNKAQRLIDMPIISTRWTHRVFDHRSAMANSRMRYLTGGAALLLIIIALLAILFVKIRRTSQEMEKAVHERTLELERQTQRADASSKAKSEFLAVMSHELRTPMNAVIGMSELGLRTDNAGKAAEYFSNIRNAGRSLLAIINDILDISRIESGNLQIIPARYDAASLLADVLSIIGTRLHDKPIAFSHDISEDLPAELIGDETRVRQVLLNLLSNAVKYTERGRIRLSVRCERLEKDEVKLAFEVQDTGIGIRKKDLDRLFGTFTRIYSGRLKNVEGTGLGLSITRNICCAMGGDVKVESEFGRGSTFTAFITQTAASERHLGRLHETHVFKISRFDVSFTAPDACVLVVDDVETNLEVVTGLLAPYRMKLMVCQNGSEAVELVRSRHFDLVLMDHMMPGMDGMEATRLIRADETERGLRTPIVALTANAVAGMREMFLANGFDGFVSKPVEINKLNAVIERWIPQKMRSGKTGDSTRHKTAKIAGPFMATLNLKTAGVDTSRGLENVDGQLPIYLVVLETFCRDAEKRLPFFGDAPQDEDGMKRFTTEAHAMKSALANIGAGDLSARAARLEQAGKDGDMTTIAENLPEFRNMLNAMARDIRSALVKPAEPIELES